MSHLVLGNIMTIGFDAHFIYLLRRYIVMNSYHHIMAYNDEDALVMAKSDQPVFILMELGHPGSIGWNLLHKLKSDQVVGRIPVVICSWQDEEQRSKQEGAESCLHMPILYEDFTKILSTIGLKSSTSMINR